MTSARTERLGRDGHKRVTHETVLGALCSYVLVGLLFAFISWR